MRIPAISALLLASAASLAIAAPPPPSVPRPTPTETKDEVHERVSYDGRRARLDRQTSEWTELASATPAKYGRVYITLDGAYARLRIEAIRGRPRVEAVRIRFANGTEKVVRVGKRLGGKRSSHDIELASARAIEHIVVVTDGGRGSYAVYGAMRPAPSAVATR